MKSFRTTWAFAFLFTSLFFTHCRLVSSSGGVKNNRQSGPGDSSAVKPGGTGDSTGFSGLVSGDYVVGVGADQHVYSNWQENMNPNVQPTISPIASLASLTLTRVRLIQEADQKVIAVGLTSDGILHYAIQTSVGGTFGPWTVIETATPTNTFDIEKLTDGTILLVVLDSNFSLSEYVSDSNGTFVLKTIFPLPFDNAESWGFNITAFKMFIDTFVPSIIGWDILYVAAAPLAPPNNWVTLSAYTRVQDVAVAGNYVFIDLGSHILTFRRQNPDGTYGIGDINMPAAGGCVEIAAGKNTDGQIMLYARLPAPDMYGDILKKGKFSESMTEWSGLSSSDISGISAFLVR